MSVRKLIDKSNDMNGFERLRHPAPSGWMSPKQGNIRSNLPRKKYIKHTNPNTRADEISKRAQTPYLATQWYRISIRIEGAGLFEDFVKFVQIGSWPFSKFLQNPSRLLPSLPYHCPGSFNQVLQIPEFLGLIFNIRGNLLLEVDFLNRFAAPYSLYVLIGPLSCGYSSQVDLISRGT